LQLFQFTTSRGPHTLFQCTAVNVRFPITTVKGFWWGNLRGKDPWGDPDIDGRIILRWIFKKLKGVVGTGWSWLRIGTGGGHL
jgi:hypothetical protein